MDNQITQELTLIVEENNLPANKTEELLKSFGSYFQEAKKLAIKANNIKITDETQVEQMFQAKELRLQLKDIRIEAEKTKVTLKEQSLREGNAIQGAFNIIKALVVPVEEYLESQEKFAENIKLQKEEAIYQERVTKLEVFYSPENRFAIEGFNLRDMSEYAFDKLFESLKLGYEAKKEVEKKAEEERLMAEKAEKAEQEQIRIENEKLKKEKLDLAQTAAIEAANMAVKLAKAKEASEKLQAAIDAKKKIEEEKEKALEEIRRQALLAPDKDKLKEFAGNIEKVFIPAVSSNEAQQIINEAQKMLLKTADFLKEKAKTL